MKYFNPLTNKETADVLKTAELIRSTITVPCTGCRYCVDDCPKKIPIPEYFSIYNDYMRFSGSQKWEAKSRYSNAAKDHGKASECIKCGKCESHCPQHLEIRETLKTIAFEFE